ncbi:MAG: ubiquinone/menaquinone biosynthesis methyltransferase [Elusimicrobia bacterium]|nr:ubiquinone/menaquinone biosynthesis methyltransferase [Elusimicrobiota bacterium]
MSRIERLLLDFYGLIAPKYEKFNGLLTFGLDGLWRKRLCLMAAENTPSLCLDICTGTGEIPRLLKRSLPGKVKITGLDFSPDMLSKAVERSDAEGICFILGNALELPFKDDSFDLVTISLATRNLYAETGDLKRYFTEFCRALKKGGVFLHLETSQPENVFMRKLFHMYVRTAIGLINMLSPRSKMPYDFLKNSALNFYNSEELSEILAESGFKDIEVYKMTFGAVCIHKGVKR